jgi:hypothetical protein
MSVIMLLSLLTILPDGGSMYAETRLAAFIAEPWNAVSSLILLVPGLLWLIRTKTDFHRNGFLCLCFGLLFLGGIGSTLFHAFRSSPVFLSLDILPMLVLTLCISWYFWSRIIKKPLLVLLIISAALICRMGIGRIPFLDPHTRGSLSYLAGGLVIFLPAILFAVRYGVKKSAPLFLSVLFFAVALLFRELDTVAGTLIPMGTHFLWHVFTAIGGYYLTDFILKVQSDQAGELPESVEDFQPLSIPVKVKPD